MTWQAKRARRPASYRGRPPSARTMVIAYHPGEPFRALLTRQVLRTLHHPLFVFVIIEFCIIRIAIAYCMTADSAKQLDLVFTYPATLIGTRFAFLIGFFVNNCFTRYMDNWRAAMIGWSRINDLALQVVERMQSGSFIDNLTAAVMVDVPAYSKEAQVFFVLHVGFMWDEYGLIHTEMSMDGFCPVYTENADMLTLLVLVFIIALGINLVVEALQARRMGLSAYFGDFSNWLDLASTGTFAYLLYTWYMDDQMMRAFVPKAQYPVYADNLALANVFTLRDRGKVLDEYVHMLGDAIAINEARTRKDLVMVIGISLVVSVVGAALAFVAVCVCVCPCLAGVALLPPCLQRTLPHPVNNRRSVGWYRPSTFIPRLG